MINEKELTVEEMSNLSNDDFIRYCWKEPGENVIREIKNSPKYNGSFNSFLDNCYACGGNWGGMLLTGIKKLYPNVYDAIPDDMGTFAWKCIVSVLYLLGVDFDEENK